MNLFNPMLDYQRNQLIAQQAMIQNQLNQMNMQNNQAQFNPFPQPSQLQFFVRQVGSVDEARSYPVDPNTMYFFLDTGNGKIYMKQLNTNNGKSNFFTYKVDEELPENKADPMQEINTRLSNIENIIGGIYGKSISNDASSSKSNGDNSETNARKNEKSKSSNVSASSANDTRKE